MQWNTNTIDIRIQFDNTMLTGLIMGVALTICYLLCNIFIVSTIQEYVWFESYFGMLLSPLVTLYKYIVTPLVVACPLLPLIICYLLFNVFIGCTIKIKNTFDLKRSNNGVALIICDLICEKILLTYIKKQFCTHIEQLVVCIQNCFLRCVNCFFSQIRSQMFWHKCSLYINQVTFVTLLCNIIINSTIKIKITFDITWLS